MTVNFNEWYLKPSHSSYICFYTSLECIYHVIALVRVQYEYMSSTGIQSKGRDQYNCISAHIHAYSFHYKAPNTHAILNCVCIHFLVASSVPQHSKVSKLGQGVTFAHC